MISQADYCHDHSGGCLSNRGASGLKEGRDMKSCQGTAPYDAMRTKSYGPLPRPLFTPLSHDAVCRWTKTANHRATLDHRLVDFWNPIEPTRFRCRTVRNIGNFQGEEDHEGGTPCSGMY